MLLGDMLSHRWQLAIHFSTHRALVLWLAMIRFVFVEDVTRLERFRTLITLEPVLFAVRLHMLGQVSPQDERFTALFADEVLHADVPLHVKIKADLV